MPPMSIANLKMRLADVPGNENPSMALEAGRIMLRWGTGYSASVDAAASDADGFGLMCIHYDQAGKGSATAGTIPQPARVE